MSNDFYLGNPANVVGYALLLSLIAKATGYTAKMLSMYLVDVHLYSNSFEQMEELLTRTPGTLPTLTIKDVYDENGNMLTGIDLINNISPDDFVINDYNPQKAIKVEMVV